ncbi:MAG: oligosaccharide flippase family protein, partial [Flavobacteriales bacterium]|nr:oligosaccharide flippase family protein [Flavobacteriales bacterium]
MQKTFLTNLGFLLLVNLLIKPFYILGIDAEVQNVVGAEDYGNYFAILNFTFLFNILNDLGITNFNNRNIAQHKEKLEAHFPRIIVLRFFLLLVYGVVTFFSGLFVGYSKWQLTLLAFLALNQGLIASIYFLRSNLSGLHLFKQDSIISVLDRALLILFCGILLWTDVAQSEFKIEWFVYAQTISYLITFLTAFVLVRRKISRLRLRIDPSFWKSIINQSAPFAILILLLSIYHRIDTVILERIVVDGDVQSGIYAQGFRFLDALNNFSFLFAVLLFPMFSRMLENGEDCKELLDLATRILISTVGIMAITCFFFRVDIIDWRYTTNIDMAATCFGLLILTAICHSTVHVFGTLLTSGGKLRTLNIISAFAVLLSLGLNLWLAPKLLALGSTIANLTTNVLVSGAHILIVHRIFGYSISGSVLLRLILLFLVMIPVGNFAHFFPGSWFISACIMGAIGVALA